MLYLLCISMNNNNDDDNDNDNDVTNLKSPFRLFLN